MEKPSAEAQQQAAPHYEEALRLEREGKDPIAAYTRALQIAPNEWAYQNRGWVYFRREEFALAVADWEQVGDAYAKPRGRAKLRTGDIDGAIAELTIALRKKPEPDIHGYLAEAYDAKGDAESAALHRKKAGIKPPPQPKKPSKPKNGESHDAYVARLLAEAPLDARLKDAIAALRRTAFFVATSSKAPRELGASRIGGEPDLPSGAEWPKDDGKPMSFIAQFRLDEIARVGESVLPKSGLLSFFVSEMGDDDYLAKCAVVHAEAKKLETLVSTPLPDDFLRRVGGEPMRKAYKARGVTFTAARRLPSRSNPLMKTMGWKGQEALIYDELSDAAIAFSRHQLLGFRDRSYDGEQEATTALLFQCFSDGATGMEWGDADHLYFYIPEQALSEGDFGKAFPYSGE